MVNELEQPMSLGETGKGQMFLFGVLTGYVPRALVTSLPQTEHLLYYGDEVIWEGHVSST